MSANVVNSLTGAEFIGTLPVDLARMPIGILPAPIVIARVPIDLALRSAKHLPYRAPNHWRCQRRLARMDSKDLTTAQAQAIRKSLFRLANYLYRLKSPMERVRFKPDDPLFVKVKAAYDAVFDLSIDLHYRGCSGGVGLSPRKPE